MIKIPEAITIMNGIFFCSEKTPQLGVFSYISNEEEIVTKRCDISSDTIQSNMYRVKTNSERVNLLTIIFLSLLCCVSIFFNMAPQIPLCLSIAIFFNREAIDILFTCFIEAHCKKECRNVYRLHSAEHCIINYYEKYGNLPYCIDDISFASMFSRKCSLYNFIFETALAVIFSVFSICCPNFWFLNFYVTFLIVYFLDRLDVLKYLEIIYLKTPTALELEIALKGMQECLAMHKDS